MTIGCGHNCLNMARWKGTLVLADTTELHVDTSNDVLDQVCSVPSRSLRVHGDASPRSCQGSDRGEEQQVGRAARSTATKNFLRAARRMTKLRNGAAQFEV